MTTMVLSVSGVVRTTWLNVLVVGMYGLMVSWLGGLIMPDLDFGWTFSVRDRDGGIDFFPVSVFANTRVEALDLLEYVLGDLSGYEYYVADISQLPLCGVNHG